MLPQLHCQRYQAFKQALKQLQASLIQLETGLDAELMTNFLQVQHFFLQQVITLSPDLLSPALESRVRSCQTEIHKQLRLLGTDFTFLQAAQQATTRNQRQVQIGDRLQTLIGYCDALLQLNGR